EECPVRRFQTDLIRKAGRVELELEGVNAGGHVGRNVRVATDGFAIEPCLGSLYALEPEPDVAAPCGLESRRNEEGLATIRQRNLGIEVLLSKIPAHDGEHWGPIVNLVI